MTFIYNLFYSFTKGFCLNIVQMFIISINKVILSHWHFYLLQNLINNCSIPKKLLLLKVVDEERLVFLDIMPGHQIRKPIGVETDQSIDYRPFLCKLDLIPSSVLADITTSVLSVSQGRLIVRGFLSLVLTILFFSLRRFPKILWLSSELLWEDQGVMMAHFLLHLLSYVFLNLMILVCLPSS